jgi:hypothetical protein
MGRKPSRPISYAKYTVWPIISKYVRLLGCLKTTGTLTHGHCYTCGRKNIPFSELEAGHCIAKYGNAVVEFEEDNLRPQCNTCNDVRRGGGMKATFKANLIKEIGQQRWDRLYYLSKRERGKHWSIKELQEIKANYEKKIQDLESRLAAIREVNGVTS